MKIKAILLPLLLFSGCAGVSGGNWIGANVEGDAGTKPVNYEQTARDYLKGHLKDPYSVQDFSVSEPVLSNCAIGIYGPFWGWRVPMAYNAKNSYGAYTGLQQTWLWFHGERLVGISNSPDFCPAIKAGI